MAYTAVAGDMASVAFAEAASLAESRVRCHRRCGFHIGLLMDETDCDLLCVFLELLP